jgi:ADP-ribose pyrophosphatase YjhB (NUDIX family)
MTAPKHLLALLEKVQSVAQNGLRFSDSPYDRERYQGLLDTVVEYYKDITNIGTDIIKERLEEDLGYITPKVSVDGAVFSDDGKILLVQRKDNNKWCLPGGWCEVTDTAKESLTREIFEETGLVVAPQSVVDVLTDFPGQNGRPHTSYHLVYYCKYVSGVFKESHETKNIGFYDYKQFKDFNESHLQMIESAYKYRDEFLLKLYRAP